MLLKAANPGSVEPFGKRNNSETTAIYRTFSAESRWSTKSTFENAGYPINDVTDHPAVLWWRDCRLSAATKIASRRQG
jgi:hypothetical protein